MNFPLSSQHFYFILILIISTFIHCATCRRRLCYSCSTEESGLNCLNSPQNVTEGSGPTVPCKFYCTIKRIEYGYPEESSTSFKLVRGCEEEPVYMDGALQDIYFITYYRACTGHLCNGGDGRERNLKNVTMGEDELMELLQSSGSMPTQILSQPNLFILSFLSIQYYTIFIS